MRRIMIAFIVGLAAVCVSVVPASAQNLVVNPSFESGSLGHGWPSAYATWSGDEALLVTAQQGIAPLGGARMLKFIYGGFAPASFAACQIDQIIDVRSHLGLIRADGAMVAVRGSFNRVQVDAQTDTQFSIWVAAFAGTPASLPNQAVQGTWLASQYVHLFSDSDTQTWQDAAVTLHLPSNTDFVAITVSSSENIYNDTTGTEFDGHYCDLVEFAVFDEGTEFMVNAKVVGMGTGAAVQGATVTVLKNGAGIADGTTDAQGRCSLVGYSNGPGGTYFVRAKLPNRSVSDASLGAVESGGAYSVTIPIPVFIELRGTVIDSVNRRGIQGSEVAVHDSSNNVVTTAITDETGHFRCEVQNPGTYHFEASKSGPIGATAHTTLYKTNTSTPTNVSSGTYAADLGFLSLETNVVVLVHGINSNSGIWSANAYPDSLRNRNWSVLDGIDLPGTFGGKHGFDRIREQAKYLKAQIDPIGVQSVNIIAHSQGGLVSRYMNENMAGAGGMVNKLIALATPQHGSPLARDAASVRDFLGDIFSVANPLLKTYQLAEWRGWVEPRLPALDDLSPNSGFLKELNQRKNWPWVDDWSGNCEGADPHSELGLVQKTSYLTVRGASWGEKYEVGGKWLASRSCSASDGIVPTESAQLYSSGSNVYNYLATDIVHHKAVPGIPVPGIVESSAVRTWVLDRLGQAPSSWPPETKAQATAGLPDQDFWGFSGYRETLLPPAGAVSDSLHIDPCDSLEIIWSWLDGRVDLVLESPTGAIIDSSTAASDPNVELDVEADGRHGTYTIRYPESGLWRLRLMSADSGEAQNVVTLLSAAGAIAFDASLSAVTSGPFADRILAAAIEAADGAPVVNAEVNAIWTAPSGATGTFVLLDDGLSPDLIASDGKYTGQLPVEQLPGATQVTVFANGSSPYAFNRNTMLSFVEDEILDIGLVGPAMQATSSNYLALSPVTLSAGVANGSAHTADVQVQFRDGAGSLLASVPGTVPALGSTDFSTMHLPLTAGTYSYGVTVVLLGSYADEDLVDNVATTSIEISAAVSGVNDDTVDGLVDGPALSALGDRGAAILAAYPNPFNPSITLEFVQRAAGVIEVRIFDIRGRLVRELYSGVQPAGGFELGWDGLDDAGKRVSSGAYFAHMRSPAGEDTKKILLVK